ncbi:MAG: glia maturation factor beta-like protein [Piptocephalis tieghemiana]|nr:MAG: glia maturation factor beta-like protein [Piptocephalis tieghemiana]
MQSVHVTSFLYNYPQWLSLLELKKWVSSQDTSGASVSLQISDALLQRLKKFRFAKTESTTALILKINKNDKALEEEEFYEDADMEELVEELPDNQPRMYGYGIHGQHEHDDGRISYPLVFIYYTPEASPQLSVLYASNKVYLQQKAGLGKVFDIRDKEDLTMDWLRESLHL